VVSEDVVEGAAALAHGHARALGVIVLFHRAGAARPLEVIAHVGGGDAAEGGLDPVAVPIVNERGAGRAAHARQAGFDVSSKVLFIAKPLQVHKTRRGSKAWAGRQFKNVLTALRQFVQVIVLIRRTLPNRQYRDEFPLFFDQVDNAPGR
jgi:hypothetical protein